MLFLYVPCLIRIVRTSSMTTARCLALFLLVLSLTPMASMYFLILWMQSPDAATSTTTAKIDSEAAGAAIHSMASRLLMERQNYNVTMEELWMALFQERITQPYSSDVYIIQGSLTHAQMKSIITMFLPWCLSLVFGVLIPLIVFLYACLRRQLWISSKTRRKRRLQRALANYRTTIAEDDRVVVVANDESSHNNNYCSGADDEPTTSGCETANSSSVEEEEEEDYSKWKIPGPGVPVNNDRRRRSNNDTHQSSVREVVGCCAICLTSYSCGDAVVWSSNPKCIHCFHESCILSWLLRRRNRRIRPCPCCRQGFMENNTA